MLTLAAAMPLTLGLTDSARAAGVNFSLASGEALLKRYGLSTSMVKRGAAGQTIFAAKYSSRGWIGKTTVTDSLGSKYFTHFEVRSVRSALKGVELYQATLRHTGRVIANSKPVGIGRFARGSHVVTGSVRVNETTGAVYWVQADNTTGNLNARGYMASLNDLTQGHPLLLTGLPQSAGSGYIVNMATGSTNN